MKTFSRIDIPLLLRRSALFLFIFFIALTFIAQLLFIFRSWDLLKAVQFGLLVAAFIIPIVAVFTNHSFWATIEKSKYLPLLWIIALAAGLRFATIPMISTDFVSDMKDTHLFAADLYAGDPLVNLKNYRYIPLATHLTLTGVVLSFVYKLFGVSTSVAKFFLVVLSVVTTWLIYLTGRELKDFKTGFVASFLFATLPSLICFTGVLAGDHFALPFIMLVILVQARIHNSGQNKVSHALIGYAICGVAIGLIDWFRPVGMILLVAVVVTTLLSQLRRQTLVQVTLAVSILVVSYFSVNKLAIEISENILQLKMLSISEKIGGYLLVGLNPESRGNITIEDGTIIGEAYRRFGRDYDAVNRYLIEYAFNRLEKGQLLELFVAKFDLMWSNHIALFDYALAGSNDQEFVYLLADFESLLFFVFTLLILVGAVAGIIRQSHPAVLTMQLFLLGFGILMLVLEAQNRYVTVVLPYSILLGALGLKDAFSLKAKNQLPPDRFS